MPLILRRNLCPRRSLRAEDTLETFAVLEENQNPQHACDQCRNDGARRHRQVKRKDVVELRSKQRQRKWHEKAEEQQQPAKDLHREEERGKMRRADGGKELYRKRICRWWLADEIEKSVQPKDRKHKAQ